MTRHEMREKIVFALYRHLLLRRDILSEIEEFDEQESEEKEYASEILKDVYKNEGLYIEEISQYLPNWNFDRENYVEQALLLAAVSELKLQKTDRAIVLDEAVQIAKKYCDEDSYRYINGVLDKI
ncbi:MAG: transcription antitermination factor NusB [Erysipelotrichaceae bacterium]|nr:transcription antitermination factor NusB [Erysipelotrichaceae bacterium]